MRLLYFNPETEYALASGASFYTPPAVVEKMRLTNQLLPEKWAEPGDIILVDDADLVSDFRLVVWNKLESLFAEIPDLKIEPWGWNKALVRKFLDSGVPRRLLPDEVTLEAFRNLAHRRTTIILNNEWNGLVDADRIVDLPVELSSEEHCLKFMEGCPGCWFKAPWSSSGRGVINTAADMTDELVRQWCHGIIRRQGSVIGEKPANRIADFATEWSMASGEAAYLGLSCFNTSRRGKYISNDCRSQQELTEYFDSICSIPLKDVVVLQKKILEKCLSVYSGPLGVDMMVEEDAKLRPFVEVNLRRTMGMLYLQ